MKVKSTSITKHNYNILRVIDDWTNFFEAHASKLQSDCVFAQGGTIDSIENESGKLVPISHTVTITKTVDLNSAEIFNLFNKHSVKYKTLGALYPWSAPISNFVPWAGLSVGQSARISSFDSGQEEERHFCASTYFDSQLFKTKTSLIKSQGTDSLVEKATLETVIFSHHFVSSDKKLIFSGAATPATFEHSDAVTNIKIALYAALEESLPSGVYIISPMITREGITTQILPALGSVKLHSDGYFHAPNSGPILTVHNGTVYIHPLYHDLHERYRYFRLLPDLTKIYLKNEAGIVRLQKALERVSLETIKNPARILDHHYRDGMRAFVVQARGAGNAPLEWKKKVKEIIAKGDTTVIVITLADSGDVDLKKYAAGLDIEGVLSGRALREDAAWILAGIIHDLKMHNQLTMDPQKLIELYCYLSGMIVLPPGELESLARNK